MKDMRRKIGRMLAILLFTGIILTLAACQAATPTPAPTATAEPAPPTETAAPTITPLVLEGAITTESGLQYLEVVTGTGDAPEAGNIITMHYIASLTDGTVLANTYAQDEPVSAVWGLDRLLPGWEEGLGLMRAGGSSRLVMPAELAFGEQGSSQVPPGSQIVFEVELISVEVAPDPTAFTDEQLVETDSGLKYVDLVEGQGAEAVNKGRVATGYVMWVQEDGGYQFVDRSAEGSPLSFYVGRGDTVFPGWEEGVTGMKVGGKRLLVIPAVLGMGDQGSGIIPPNAVIVMEIELAEASDPREPTQVDEQDYTTTETGLKYYDLEVGTGETPSQGQVIVAHYTGWLEDGTIFDTSLDSGQPISFPIGEGRVIPGWDEGLATMKVGGVRQLVIPPDLAYADAGAGKLIPPGATLIFEVELVEIQQ